MVIADNRFGEREKFLGQLRLLYGKVTLRDGNVEIFMDGGTIGEVHGHPGTAITVAVIDDRRHFVADRNEIGPRRMFLAVHMQCTRRLAR